MAHGLQRFFAELKRRNVYRAAVAYCVVGWLVVQIATQVFPFFDVPNWGVRLVVLLVIAGFPIALIFAWVFEITPGGLKRSDEVPPQQSIARRTGRRIDVFIICLLAAAVALLLFDRLWRRSTAASRQKSIAVLPFENFSDDKSDAFFADGIQDDILTSLAKIADLKVISRTSVMQFRGGARNLREIAKALGVTNVLEGSVRHVKDRVLVNVQLIDAINDRHLWADRYDRTISDIISLQGELATEIANALRATLSPEEKARVETKPTQNAEAYTLMLRARELENSPDISLDQYLERERLYTRAVALDPRSARAHAGLGFVIANIFHEFDPTKERADRAFAEAREALRLDPNSEEAHVAIAHCYYWVQADYAAAIAELHVAEKLAPNSVDVTLGLAAISRRQGHWREALDYFYKALSLDPRNGGTLNELTFTYFQLRDWSSAIATADRLIEIAPNAATSAFFRAYAEYFATGEPQRAENVLDRIASRSSADESIVVAHYDLAMCRRDFDAAARAVASLRKDNFPVPSAAPVPRTFLEGSIAFARGDRAAATPLLDASRQALEAEVARASDDGGRHAQLAFIDALLGRKEEAIAHARRATELKPESKDAILGPLRAATLALVYAWSGERDQAIALLQHLLAQPGSIDLTEFSTALADLRLRWVWDPLRDDPRFQRLIATSERAFLSDYRKPAEK